MIQQTLDRVIERKTSILPHQELGLHTIQQLISAPSKYQREWVEFPSGFYSPLVLSLQSGNQQSPHRKSPLPRLHRPQQYPHRLLLD